MKNDFIPQAEMLQHAVLSRDRKWYRQRPRRVEQELNNAPGYLLVSTHDLHCCRQVFFGDGGTLARVKYGVLKSRCSQAISGDWESRRRELDK